MPVNLVTVFENFTWILLPTKKTFALFQAKVSSDQQRPVPDVNLSWVWVDYKTVEFIVPLRIQKMLIFFIYVL